MKRYFEKQINNRKSDVSPLFYIIRGSRNPEEMRMSVHKLQYKVDEDINLEGLAFFGFSSDSNIPMFVGDENETI